MPTLGNLLINLTMNTAGIAKGVAETNRKLDGFAKKTQQIARIAGAAFASIQIVELGKSLIDINDKYQLLEGRLKLVAKEGENLAATQDKLFNIAQDTRTGTEGTIDLYTRLARATKDIDISQEDLLQTTEAINKAITISGSTATEANAALFQLGQGLSAGALRGEELNSVLEQTPRVAQAIADGLGITISQLRELGSEGKLNAKTVIDALRSQGEVLNKEFAGIPVTVAQSFTQLQNAFERAAKGMGGLNKLVKLGIQSLTNYINLYNDFFNPSVKQQFDDAVDRLQQLEEKLAKSGRNRGNISLLKGQIEQQKLLVNELNNQLIAEQKLRSEAEKAAADKKPAEPINLKAQQERLAGLALEERYIRDALTSQEKFSAEVARLNGLWQGALITTDEYKEKIRELAGLGKEVNPDDLVKGFGITPGARAEFFDSELEAERNFIEMSLEQNRAWKDKLAEIDEQNKKRREASNRSLLGSTASLFGSLATIVGSGSKKQFEIGKQLARAETIVSTYASAQLAYQQTLKFAGPVAAAAAAAAAVAAGLARLAAINRTTFESSSAAAAQTGAGTFVPSPTPGPVTPGQTTAGGQTFVIITDGNITEAQIDDILDRASERINEGSQVIIRRDSVQAAEIAAAVA